MDILDWQTRLTRTGIDKKDESTDNFSYWTYTLKCHVYFFMHLIWILNKRNKYIYKHLYTQKNDIWHECKSYKILGCAQCVCTYFKSYLKYNRTEVIYYCVSQLFHPPKKCIWTVKEYPTHLPFNAATPTVLLAIDILATNVHCWLWGSHLSTVFK